MNIDLCSKNSFASLLCCYTGAIAIIGGQFSNTSVPVVAGRVDCIGNETGLLECPHVSETHEEVVDCDRSEVAAITCQSRLFFRIKLVVTSGFPIYLPDPLNTEFADCTTGEVRLEDFTDNSSEGSRQGTIQICINHAWGSVCSDDFFDNTDAAVFCHQLSGFTSEGIFFHRECLMTSMGCSFRCC